MESYSFVSGVNGRKVDVPPISLHRTSEFCTDTLRRLSGVKAACASEKSSIERSIWNPSQFQLGITIVRAHLDSLL